MWLKKNYAGWFISWSNGLGLQAGGMVYKESKWFTSRPNGLQAGWKAYKLAERATVQVDRECKVAKMGYKKVESSFMACQEESCYNSAQ